VTSGVSPAELLYEALNAELGVIVTSPDPNRLRQRLYAEQRRDPELACITISSSRSAPQTDLWLIRKDSTRGEEKE